jgi:hypothetical protein
VLETRSPGYVLRRCVRRPRRRHLDRIDRTIEPTTIDSEPLIAGELFDYLAELVEPPRRQLRPREVHSSSWRG